VTNPATRYPSLVTGLLFGGVLLLAGCGKSGITIENSPPPNDPSQGSGFTSLEYFDPPNQTQIKSRLTGTDEKPLPDGLIYLKQPKLEFFYTNGTPQAVVEAPECVYDMQQHTVNSAAHLQMRSGDGKFRVEGDGFLWRHDDFFLYISNHVHTVIEPGPESKAHL
jgi:hypothetical protein